mgnify:CR=1 FL=1
MNYTTDKLLSVARQYVGTPYHHEGRVKGVGIDCVGLVICIHAELGIVLKDSIPYPQSPPPGMLDQHLKERDLQLIPRKYAKPGDFATFWITHPGSSVHLGILTESGLIHCYTGMGKVVEHWMNRKWHRRIVSVRRSKDIAPGKLEIQWQL